MLSSHHRSCSKLADGLLRWLSIRLYPNRRSNTDISGLQPFAGKQSMGTARDGIRAKNFMEAESDSYPARRRVCGSYFQQSSLSLEFDSGPGVETTVLNPMRQRVTQFSIRIHTLFPFPGPWHRTMTAIRLAIVPLGT